MWIFLHSYLCRIKIFRENELRNTGYCHYCGSCCYNIVIGALFGEHLLLLVATTWCSIHRWTCTITNFDITHVNHEFSVKNMWFSFNLFWQVSITMAKVAIIIIMSMCYFWESVDWMHWCIYNKMQHLQFQYLSSF